MDWGSAENIKDDNYKIPTRWLFLHYYEALNILFRVENALRVLVYVVLKNEHKDRWAELTIVSDEGDTTISAVASRRKSQAATFGYLGYPVTCPLMYLTTGELARLITSDPYWNLFRTYFLGARDIIATKLAEIISVRNALSHFRPIKQDDVDTIKQASKHVLTTAETALAEMLRCTTTVPSNSTDKWYTDLRVLGTQYSKLRFYQSANEAWIRIDLAYEPPTSSQVFGKNFNIISTLKLNAPGILREYPALAAVVIYLTESVSAWVSKAGKAGSSKTVSLGFSRRTLEGNQDVVKAALKGVLGLIEEETELIKQDNLARGKLVSSASTSVQTAEDENWNFADSYPLESGFKEADPPEWWGEINLYTSDFVSSTHIFPWSPAAIAKKQFS